MCQFLQEIIQQLPMHAYNQNYCCKRPSLQVQQETLGPWCFQRLPKFAPSQLLSVIASICVAASA